MGMTKKMMDRIVIDEFYDDEYQYQEYLDNSYNQLILDKNV